MRWSLAHRVSLASGAQRVVHASDHAICMRPLLHAVSGLLSPRTDSISPTVFEKETPRSLFYSGVACLAWFGRYWDAIV